MSGTRRLKRLQHKPVDNGILDLLNRIAIENDIFRGVPHMRSAIMHLRKYGQRDYQAVFLAQRTSELGILSFCHLLRTCKVTENNKCVVTHNNQSTWLVANPH